MCEMGRSASPRRSTISTGARVPRSSAAIALMKRGSIGVPATPARCCSTDSTPLAHVLAQGLAEARSQRRRGIVLRRSHEGSRRIGDPGHGKVSVPGPIRITS